MNVDAIGKSSPMNPPADEGPRFPFFPRAQSWLLGLFLVGAIILAYQPAWHAEFIWDDDAYVTANPLLTAPDGLGRIWFSTDSPSQYFPLTYTVFRLEHALWGFNPTGYHWVNLLLHAVNALLVWSLLKRLDIPGAGLAAAIFALHPVQVESVAWITECKNVLMCAFFLLALLCWIEFIAAASSGRWRFYLLALMFYALALFSKTTACTLPAALLLILWLKGEPLHQNRLAQIVPFLAMGVAMGLLTIWWERFHQGTQGRMFSLGLTERLLVAGHAVWFYAGKLLWPVDLMFSYPKWTIKPADPLAYSWLAGGMALCVAIYYGRKHVGRGVEVAVLFFVATLSPVLGLIMLYTFRFTFVADHYQYVASIGLIALAAAGITMTLRGKPILKSMICGLLLLALGVLTWRQCRMYAGPETLWETTIARNPGSWLAENNLGDVFLRAGQLDEATVHLNKAIAIQPNNAEAYDNLGAVLLQKGQSGEAIVQFQKALSIQPDKTEALNNLGNALARMGQVDKAMVYYQKALSIQPDYVDAHNNLGTVLLRKGQVDEALIQFQRALAIQPDHAQARYNLGNVLLQQGRLDEAIVNFQRALAVEPDNAETRNNLGIALLRKGQADAAIIEFQRALAIRPDYAKACYNLGTALLHNGQSDEAIVQFQKALAIQPGMAEAQIELARIAWVLATSPDPAVRNGTKAVELAWQADRLSGGGNPMMAGTLAAAYAETGRFAEAVANAERALQLAAGQNNAARVAALKEQLKSYQAGSPFRDANASR